MNIFIKESLYLLDYEDHILDVLFLSTDKDTPGQAYEINIKENNTGYSDLTFKMPSTIVDANGRKIINPKLKVLNRVVEGIEDDREITTGLVPLSKVRYERVVRYMGTDQIDFPGPNGTTITYPKNDGLNPEDYIIEDYIMDYIIQPLDKARQSLKIDLTYTAIDFPRFNLSKKKLGLTIDQNTLTIPDLSLFTNAPMSVPGKIQYIPWTASLAKNYQSTEQVNNYAALSGIKQPNKGEVYYVVNSSTISGVTYPAGYYQYNGEGWDKKNPEDFIVWEPNPQSGGYPLSDASVQKLVKQTSFTNGILATVYYWPVKMPEYVDETGHTKERETARFEGVTYEKGSFITLSLYNTYEGIESAWEGSEYLEDIAWDWNYLEPMQLYLNPNNACNLLRYILQNTNWSVMNDEGVDFIKNSASQPWYTSDPGLSPSSYREGQYYIIRTSNSQEGALHPYLYTIKQLRNGTWENRTSQLIQIVNTDETDIEHFGVMYDIDIEQVKVARTAEGYVGQDETMDAQYNLNVSNANCYNAITTEAKLFDLYPVFDCVKRMVSLKKHAGANHGLIYRAGRNLKTSSIKLDGEKVITKLYVTGGSDSQGSSNINLGEAVRAIEGYSLDIYSPTATSYITSTYTPIKNNMEAIQTEAYNRLVGTAIQSSRDYSTNEILFQFPELYAYNVIGITRAPGQTWEQALRDTANQSKLNQSISRQTLLTFTIANSSTGAGIYYRYDGVSHCFYVYYQINGESDNDKKWLDETRQIYKYDCTNMVTRRNLTGWEPGRIGRVSAVGNNAGNYIKYIPNTQMTDPNYLFQNNKVYVGYTKTTVLDGAFTLSEIPESENELEKDKSFVLAGPSQVYEADNTTQSFTQGKYYHMDNKYYYCAGKINFTAESGQPYYHNTSYDKNNKISVSGYVFIDLGNGNQNLIISCDGENYTIRTKDNEIVKVKDWLSNGYAIRVLPEGNILQEVYPLNEDTNKREFDPNAPEYLVGRSPYGTSYIYNFKYLYDNEWITEKQILDIYKINHKIHADNLDFFNRYAQELTNARVAYLDAINNLELYESKGDAQLETLMSQYWQNPMVASKGKFSAFPYQPNFVYTTDTNKHMFKGNITYDGEVVKTIYYNVYNSPGALFLYPNHTDGLVSAENPETEGQYHVVAKALGWDSYKSNVLPLDATYAKPDSVLDPSDTVSNYNKIINNMKLYYYKAKKANEEMDQALTVVEELEELYNVWQNRIAGYEKELQENFGQYIIEGSYSNTEQPYPNLLLRDGLTASKKYAIPDVTYGVNVVDASGMIEYRAPQNLIANELVKKLHGLGQVIPKVGDYIAIYDNEMGLFKVDGLITVISRRIDDPYQNAITIDTSYTDADELVGQIITATNTVLNNKDIYGRAAIISNKGELQTSTVTDALSTGKNSISITSTNGKITVDNNGLTATNPENDSAMMRYNGSGILGSEDGGLTWRNLMNQDGINANYIAAGTLNSTKVSVTNGQYDTVILDGSGLTVKTNPGRNYTLGYATNNGIIWPQNSNVSVFVGKDENNVGIGYFDGYINATKGGNIAGWQLSTNRLTAPNNTTYLSSNGDYAFYTEQNGKYAGIKHDGTLVGNNVSITGGSLTIGSNFIVTNNGNLTASNANVNGTITTNNITATGGTIGGWTISGTTISQTHDIYKVVLANYNNENPGSRILHCTKNPGTNNETDTFWVKRNGSLYCSNVDIQGTITGSSISGSSFVAENTKLGSKFRVNKDGNFVLYNGTGFIRLEDSGGSYNHPWLSAVHVNQLNGVQFRTGTTYNGIGNSTGSISFTNNKDDGQMNIKCDNDINIKGSKLYLIPTGALYLDPGGTVNITAGSHGKFTTASNCYLKLQAGSSNPIPSTNGSMYLYAQKSISFNAKNGNVYVGAGGTTNTRVATDSSGPSSKCLKTNIVEFNSTEYKDALTLLQDIKIYDYNYKYNIHPKKDQYGFIIDDLLEKPLAKKFLYFKDETAGITQDNSLDYAAVEEHKNLPIIDFKRYDEETLIKYLLVVCKGLQQEIEQLKKERV